MSQASHIALSTIYYEIGHGFKEAGETSYSIEAYQESLWHNPTYTLALNNIGNTFSEMGKFDLAKEYLEKAVAANPEQSVGYYTLGNAYVREWQYDKGIEQYKLAYEYLKHSKDPERFRAIIKATIKRTQDFRDSDMKRMEKQHTYILGEEALPVVISKELPDSSSLGLGEL